ncbi:hypothetical protein GGF43_004528 [Coemansia sp. RSA 2618]|nr:hypothetical protein GGF43_004528 [Coemansia sp. RSA 2618]
MDVRQTPPLPQTIPAAVSKFVEAQASASHKRTDVVRPASEPPNVLASTGIVNSNVTSQPQTQPIEVSGYQGPGPQYSQAAVPAAVSSYQRPLPENNLYQDPQPAAAQGAAHGPPRTADNTPGAPHPPPPPPSYSDNMPARSTPTVQPGYSSNQHMGNSSNQHMGYNSNQHMGTYGQPYMSDRNYVSAAPAPVQPNDVYAPQPMPMPANMHGYNPFAPFQPMAPYAAPREEPARAASKAPSSSSSSSAADEDDGKPANTYANRFKAILSAVTISEVGPMLLLTGGMLAHHYRNRSASKLVPYQMPKWIRYLKNMLFAYNALKFSRNNGLIKAPPKIQPTWPQETGKRGIPGDVTAQAAGTRGLGGHDTAGDPGAAPQNDIVMQMVNAMVGELFGGKDALAHSSARAASGVLDGFDHSWAVPKALAEQSHRDVYFSQRSIREIEPHFMGGAAAIQALETERRLFREQHAGSVVDSQHEYRVMGLALSECDALLERKADAGELGPDDTLQLVGKVALATIIKIKAEEEENIGSKGPSRPRSQPAMGGLGGAEQCQPPAEYARAYTQPDLGHAYSHPEQQGQAYASPAQSQAYVNQGHAHSTVGENHSYDNPGHNYTYDNAYAPPFNMAQQHPPALDTFAHHSFYY